MTERGHQFVDLSLERTFVDPSLISEGDALPYGILSTSNAVTPEQREAVASAWDRAFSGRASSRRFAILPSGFTFQPLEPFSIVYCGPVRPAASARAALDDFHAGLAWWVFALLAALLWAFP